MDMIPLRSLARKALAHLSNNCRISASSFAAVRAFGIHRSMAHASVSTKNAKNFFIVGSPPPSHNYAGTDPDSSDYAQKTHGTGPIIWWRVRRSQANCIKFIGCGAGPTILDEWSANE